MDLLSFPDPVSIFERGVVLHNLSDAMAIAEHAPQKLNQANRGLLKMSHQQLHEFADTPEKGLPLKKRDRS